MSSRQAQHWRQIFLSHSGYDASRARALGATLEKELTGLGHPTKVFNTSETQYRTTPVEKLITNDEPWAHQFERYDEELRRYLTRNLLSSDAYVLLVTSRSLWADSAWVKFEIETAVSLAKDRDFFFFPAVAGGAGLSKLPEGSIEFEGCDLEEAGGIERLISVIKYAFEQTATT